MARFLIEVPHEAKEIATTQVAAMHLNTGSHFPTQVDCGRVDGEHNTWIFVEAGSKEEARSNLPAALRHQARIVQLTLEEIDSILRRHHPSLDQPERRIPRAKEERDCMTSLLYGRQSDAKG